MLRGSAVAAVVVALTAAAPAQAAKTRCTSRLSTAQTVAGTPVKLTGRVTPKRARSVRLQARAGKAWPTLAKGRTSKAGRFRFTVPAASSGTVALRALLPAAGRAPRVSCGLRVLEIAPAKQAGDESQGASTSAGPAWRAIYALASDQTEDPAKAAAIAATAEAVNGWFATQTTGGVRPRWQRTSSGAIAVTTITLGHTVADYAAAADSFDLVAADLRAHGLPAVGDDEKLAGFIDVTNAGACGATQGDVVLMFEAACDIHPTTTDPFPYGSTYLLAHEMTHGFGAVASCAPHAGNGGHVLDDPRDILFAGDGARDWDHLTLDPGHDDYYATGRADCAGIESSPFWTATSDPLS